MVRLVDVLGTHYLVEHFATQVKDVLEKYKEIDIGGARLTPLIASEILSYLNLGGIVVDSENKERNSLLQENMRRLSLKYDVKLLPLFGQGQRIYDYLKSLDKDTIYTVGGDLRLNIPIAVLAQIFIPEIQFDFGSDITRIFAYITDILYMTHFEDIVKTTEDYNIIIGDTPRLVHITEKDLNSTLYIYGIGNIDWKTLRSKYLILPDYFGKVRIRQNANLIVLWDGVVNECFKGIETYLKSKRTIRGFLGGTGI